MAKNPSDNVYIYICVVSVCVSVCVLQLYSAPRRSTLASDVQSEVPREGRDHIYNAVYSTGASLDAKNEAAHYFTI